jgi:elongator complex protein 2
MDKTMMLWEPDSSGVWVPSITVGDVGGHNLGLYGALFSPRGDAILSIGYGGAFHLWRRRDDDKSIFDPAVTVSGHFGPVVDLAWNEKDK